MAGDSQGPGDQSLDQPAASSVLYCFSSRHLVSPGFGKLDHEIRFPDGPVTDTELVHSEEELRVILSRKRNSCRWDRTRQRVIDQCA